MQISEQLQGAVTVLKPAGPLTATDAEELRGHLSRALTASLGRLVLDMSEIPYVDSAGLESLVDASEQMSESGQALKLCAANKTIKEVLYLTDLNGLFEQYDDVNSAVRSFL